MKILFSLFLFCALAMLAPLEAMNDFGGGTVPADPAGHVGTHSRYKIGTADNPVIAEEYNTFLVEKAGNEDCWFSSSYYDSAFMNVVNDWPANSTTSGACIQRSGGSRHYIYTVIPGHKNDIIDGLQSEYAQKEFNAWRAQGPCVLELCNYMNEQISGNSNAAAAIKSRYRAPIAISLFDELDVYAQRYVTYSNQASWYTSQKKDCTVTRPLPSNLADVAYLELGGWKIEDNTNNPTKPLMYKIISREVAVSIPDINTQTLAPLFFIEKGSKKLYSETDNVEHSYNTINYSSYAFDNQNQIMLKKGDSSLEEPIVIPGKEANYYYHPSSIQFPQTYSQAFVLSIPSTN